MARRRPGAAGRSSRAAPRASRCCPKARTPTIWSEPKGRTPSAQVLADARPLADLLWMRETSGGVFDTPERKAELEKTLRELTGRIKDESLRFHYAQEMRERVQTFFGGQRRSRCAPANGKRARAGSGGTGRPVREPAARQPLRRCRKALAARRWSSAAARVMPAARGRRLWWRWSTIRR